MALTHCTQQSKCLLVFPWERWQSDLVARGNAGLFAVQILATQSPELEEKLLAYKEKLSDGVAEKAARLQTVGYENY